MNQSNNTQDETYCKFHEPDSSTERWIKFIALLVFIGIGFIGNVFVIILAVKFTVKRSLHFLIINVAVADILFDLANLFFEVTAFFRYDLYNRVNVALAETFCKTSVYIYRVFLSESLLTLLIISIERYRVTSQTVRISRPFSRKRGLVIIACSWIIALVTNLYLPIFRNVVKRNSAYVCITKLERTPAIVFYLISMNSKLFFCLAMVVVCILTLRKLSKVSAIESSISYYQRLKRKKRIRGAVNMVLYSLLLSSSWFIPTYTLAILMNFTRLFATYCIDWRTIQFLAFEFFPILNICLNPCIYCACLTDFRKAARRLLCCDNRISVSRENTIETVTAHRLESTRM
ncbi:melanocortin receptor 5-like [Exaiptasia diaphana]|uniref:G-protein coupled receptors family 1 profile domain-containing protein n=1 Tax=Exaiptasia diaphana TaxID=2652724 RepID=A0A913XE37_EXADI|nr:melanocortin receptor 5-like [Exaiptasia diaphana]XP_020903262.1 melanocortin receptor 5-like [Exaiptasia diaphana]XP_020903263.1 melanocortin receptor 5-like [Exaiptasia diaphana]